MGSKSLWATCKTCSKQISTSAPMCPLCGARQARYRWVKWLGVGIVVLAVAGAVTRGHESASRDTQTAKPNQLSSESSVAVRLPDQQQRFLAVAKDYAERFASAKNELQQSVLRRERGVSLMDALGSQRTMAGWVGTIVSLQTNTQGRAILSVRLSQNVEISTYNNALSDVAYNTLIDQGTPLFDALLSMSVGDKVAVSGTFFPSDSDWITETSFTIRGSMTDPAFLVRFHTISKQ